MRGAKKPQPTMNATKLTPPQFARLGLAQIVERLNPGFRRRRPTDTATDLDPLSALMLVCWLLFAAYVAVGLALWG